MRIIDEYINNLDQRIVELSGIIYYKTQNGHPCEEWTNEYNETIAMRAALNAVKNPEEDKMIDGRTEYTACDWTEIIGPESFPPKDQYDWVLVACKLMPEGWYGVPHIAELRGDVWYEQSGLPLEGAHYLKVTHWAPLLENPKVKEYPCTECGHYDHGCMAPFIVGMNVHGNCSGFKKRTVLGVFIRLPLGKEFVKLEKASEELREAMPKINDLIAKDSTGRDKDAYIKDLENRCCNLDAQNKALKIVSQCLSEVINKMDNLGGNR